MKLELSYFSNLSLKNKSDLILIATLLIGIGFLLYFLQYTIASAINFYDSYSEYSDAFGADSPETQKLRAIIPHFDDMAVHTDYTAGSEDLVIGQGIFWILAYILIIRRGFIDKSYGMPLVALMFNFSWEVIMGYIHSEPMPQGLVNKVWAFVDLLIVYQAIRYGYQDFKDRLSQNFFYLMLLSGFLMAFFLVLFVIWEFGDFEGKYAGWGMNAAMSLFFILMLVSRNSIKGQSVYIAISKMIGTIFINFAQLELTSDSVLLPLLMTIITFFDLVYLALLYLKAKEANINPWMRF